jgi:hypothetical protein
MKGLIALALAAAALLVPSSAWAAPSPSSTGADWYDVEVGEIVDSPTGAGPSPGLADVDGRSSRCKRVWAARVLRNIFGTALWRYYQQQGFCYDGIRITSLYDWRRWAEVYVSGWDFVGHVDRRITGRSGTWHYGTWTQGKFRLCFQFCVDTKLPWVDIDVYGNGGWSHKTGGT